MRGIQNILLVEDNPGDADLTREAFREAGLGDVQISVVWDGVEALNFLRRNSGFENAPRPGLIFLDLNLPKLSGRDVLETIKRDPKLCQIPVIVLSSSDAPSDIGDSYDRYANCYLSKPLDFDQFIALLKVVKAFWFDLVDYPDPAKVRPGPRWNFR